MNRLFTYIFLCFFGQILVAQQHVSGQLKSTKAADLHVIRLQSDSFPRVAVTFHATDLAGNPVWNIEQKDVRVTENGQTAKVIKLRPLAEDNGLYSMLVIDHSGSMGYDQRYYDWLASFPIDSAHPDTVTISHRWEFDPANPEKYKYVKLAKDSVVFQYRYLVHPDFSLYKSPMYYAQQASIQYVKTMNSPTDKVGVLGFSDQTDVRIPNCKNEPQYRSKILGMNANGGTAFYDAVDEALRSLVTHKGHRAIVALTDGQDNSSVSKLSGVIALAQKMRIPVYVIGLGNVDSHPLQRLAMETGGEYHYTNDAQQLGNLFMRISRKIKAVYELVYQSPYLTSATPEHDVQLIFDVDTAFLKTQIFELPLPASVVHQLELRETLQPAVLPVDSKILEEQAVSASTNPLVSEANEPEDNEFPYGLLFVSIAVVGAGALLVKARYNKDRAKSSVIQLHAVYPNPASGPVTLSYTADIASGPVAVCLLNTSGQSVLQESLDFSGTHQFDVSNLPTGSYFVRLQSSSSSAVLPLIVQH